MDVRRGRSQPGFPGAPSRHHLDQRLPPYLPQAEWGGFKKSGIGRELGPSGLEEYQVAKHVYHNTQPAVTGWFPQK